ncbi:MAG: hypothetical protein AAF170_08055 [Bacteroidota bacterium]
MRPAVVVLLMTLAWTGCDSAPGAVERSERPAIANVEVTPLSDSLETAAPTASIPLTVRLTLDGPGPIVVRVLVRYAETDTLVASSTDTVEPGAVELAVPLTLPRGATGDYAVSIITEGPDGRAGDEASARFRFKAASLGPPTVTVEAPTTVTAPASGSRPATLPIVATATDPDGRENIVLVLIQDVDGFILGRIYDEGPNGRSDDDTAGDGRYSGSLQIPPGFPAGMYTLAATAVDRAGELSDPASFTFTVR